MSRRAGPCLPPTAVIRPSAMAMSPQNAALPVPSMIVPPRITMSCMPTSRRGSRRRRPRRDPFSLETTPVSTTGEVGLPCNALNASLHAHKKSGHPAAFSVENNVGLLAEMRATVLAAEPGPGLTDEAIAGGIPVVVSAIVVAIVVGRRVIVGIGIVI